MKANTKDLEFIKREFDAIVAYEKALNTPFTSASRIINYFGTENVCKIFNCSIVSDRVARVIIEDVMLAK